MKWIIFWFVLVLVNSATFVFDIVFNNPLWVTLIAAFGIFLCSFGVVFNLRQYIKSKTAQ